jgi:hypothetical protein
VGGWRGDGEREGEETNREREARAGQAARVRRGGGETGGTYVCSRLGGCGCLLCVGVSVPRRAWAGGAALSGASGRAEEERAGRQAGRQAGRHGGKGKARQARQAGPRLCRAVLCASASSSKHAVCRAST